MVVGPLTVAEPRDGFMSESGDEGEVDQVRPYSTSLPRREPLAGSIASLDPLACRPRASALVPGLVGDPLRDLRLRSRPLDLVAPPLKSTTWMKRKIR